MGRAKDKLSTPKRTFIAQVIDQLATVKFAVTVVVIIAAACIAGTLIPQGADVAKYVRHYPDAASRLNLFGLLGLTHIFYSVWFIGLLCTLAATVAVCSTRRFTTVLRTSGYARYRAFGSMLTHISILLILAGGVIRGVWGEKGYIELREGETNAQVVTESGAKPLSFAIHLTKFEIETYDQPGAVANRDALAEKDAGGDVMRIAWPERNLKATLPVTMGVEQAFGEFRITVLKYLPDFVVDMQTREVTSRSNEPRNPAILVAVNGPTYQNHRWLFAKFPDFEMHTKDTQSSGQSPLQMVYESRGAAAPKMMPAGPIKSFKSTLELVEGESVVGHRVVEVNSPFTYKGYTFYQSGYNPEDLSYTSLQVVKDPGVVVVYSGFALMIAGLFIVFYLNPWLDTRRKTA
ncbi:MAG TPA: cytochrome c biogenesis protein ResB [Verrucomicrobiae bacterium]|nr:cytochrome c biogenesis protein ResB [Verrucomicrobiae bacterium]